MHARRKAREALLQSLYEADMKGMSYIEAKDALKNSHGLSKNLYDYAYSLLLSIDSNLEEINTLINTHSKNWSIDRIAVIDKNIMRLAIAELLFNKEEVPFKVVIDEAVELAKSYGSDGASSFVNAILDKIAKNKS